MKYLYFLVETGALFKAILCNLFTFIDHKSKMTQIDSLISIYVFYRTCQ